MADEKFVDFARRRLKFGTPKQDVAATLRVNGLSDADIEEVLAAATQGAAVPATPTPTPISPPPSPPAPAEEPVPVVPVPAVQEEMPTPFGMPQSTPTQEMSHISVMPKMAPLVAAPRREVPLAAPQAPIAAISAVQRQTPPAVVPQTPAALVYAGFWRRFAAAFIDGVILTFLYSGIVLGVSFSFGTSSATYLADYMKGVGGIITALSLLVAILYHPLLEASAMQGSLGKHFLGLIVTDTDGMRVTFFRALLRNLAKVTSAATVMIGFLMIAFTKQKQGLHDIIAGCLVLRHEHHQEG